MAELREEGVDVNLKDVEKRRKYWLDIHNAVKRNSQTSVYSVPLEVIFSGEPIERLKGTEFAVDDNAEIQTLRDPMKIAATAAMFSKGNLGVTIWSLSILMTVTYIVICLLGAVFTTEAACYLIKVVKTNLHVLQQSKNQDHFWREVKLILAEKGYHYDESSCERKFLHAKKLYRDYVLERNKTGKPGPSEVKNVQSEGENAQSQGKNASSNLWFWNENMHAIMAKDDISSPPITLCAGSSDAVRLNAPHISHPAQNEPHVPLIGRSKVPALKRPKSKQQAKAEMYNSVVAAMDRRTAAITAALQGKKKGPNVDNDFRPEDEEEERRRGGAIPKLFRP